MTEGENEAFWNDALERFVGARTAKLSVIALAEALESKEPMPEWARDVLAMMIRGRWPLVGPFHQEWTLSVVRRRDLKQHNRSERQQQIFFEVNKMVKSGHSKAHACRQVSESYGLTQRAVEKICAKHESLFRQIRERVRARKNA